jgi:hypothetical protein
MTIHATMMTMHALLAFKILFSCIRFRNSAWYVVIQLIGERSRERSLAVDTGSAP